MEARSVIIKLIGQEQKLFMFSKLSPGSPFLFHMAHVSSTPSRHMLREQYWDRGYQEVQSPNMYDVELVENIRPLATLSKTTCSIVQVKDDSADPMPLSDHAMLTRNHKLAVIQGQGQRRVRLKAHELPRSLHHVPR